MHTILRKRFRHGKVGLTGVNLFIQSVSILTPPADEVTIQIKSITYPSISSFPNKLLADLEGVGGNISGKSDTVSYFENTPVTVSNSKPPGVFL
jgi:hypothetical protein